MVKDVLVFTPVLRLEPETVEAIFSLEWEGTISYLFQRDNPVGRPSTNRTRIHECTNGFGSDKQLDAQDERAVGIFNHLHQFERGREAFLAGSYDAMLVVESDIIPPADALRRLAAMDVDCAYGVYRFRVSNVINVFELYPGKPRNVGESLSLHPRKLKAAIRDGVVPCSGAGFGCVLIRRRVLDEIPFRVEWPEEGGHCDSPFVRDVLRRGFTQMADMSVICGHKREDGEVLWPEYP